MCTKTRTTHHCSGNPGDDDLLNAPLLRQRSMFGETPTVTTFGRGRDGNTRSGSSAQSLIG